MRERIDISAAMERGKAFDRSLLMEAVVDAARDWRRTPRGTGNEQTALWRLRDAIDRLDKRFPPSAPKPERKEADG